MSKKYTVKDWLDCKVAITFNSKEELERFAEMVKPHGIKWRNGDDFGYKYSPGLDEILLGFRKGEERIASRGATSRYTCINFKDLQLSNVKQEIHITTDGIKNTYAVLKENGKVVKKVQAKCHPDDPFNFEIGSALVMERLFPKVKEAKRSAKKGEYVKVTRRECGHHFAIGEIVKNFNGSTEFVNSKDEFWSMCPTEYVVLEGYKPTKKDASKEIKVGDMVTVVNNGRSYSHYSDWFNYVGCKHLERHFVMGKAPEEEHEYKVVFTGEHKNEFERTKGKLYAIQNLDTTQVFIIGEKGIKKV